MNRAFEFKAEKLLLVGKDEDRIEIGTTVLQTTQKLINFEVKGSKETKRQNTQSIRISIVYIMAAVHSLYMVFVVTFAVSAKCE